MHVHVSVIPYLLWLLGNGNAAELYNTDWTAGPWGTEERAVRFTGADDQ